MPTQLNSYMCPHSQGRVRARRVWYCTKVPARNRHDLLTSTGGYVQCPRVDMLTRALRLSEYNAEFPPAAVPRMPALPQTPSQNRSDGQSQQVWEYATLAQLRARVSQMLEIWRRTTLDEWRSSLSHRHRARTAGRRLQLHEAFRAPTRTRRNFWAQARLERTQHASYRPSPKPRYSQGRKTCVLNGHRLLLVTTLHMVGTHSREARRLNCAWKKGVGQDGTEEGSR
jgi:hypothetical protein